MIAFGVGIWLAVWSWELRSDGTLRIPWEIGLAIGAIYGLASASCFLASALSRRGYRMVARGLTIVVGVVALTATGRWSLGLPLEPERYLLFLGGMTVVQASLAPLAGVPDWTLAPAADAGGRRQFQIGDLLAATTLLAILFAVGARYPPSIDPALFWIVLLGCWILLPLVASLAMAAALRRRFAMGGLLAAMCLFLSGVATLGLTGAEQAISGGTMPSTWLWSLYGTLLGAYCFVVGMIGLAGRCDRHS